MLTTESQQAEKEAAKATGATGWIVKPFVQEKLLALGTGIALPHFTKLPTFDQLRPQFNYTCFEILLETSKQESDMRNVLMFVETESELHTRAFPLSASLTEQVKRLAWRGHTINMPQGFDAFSAILSSGANLINSRGTTDQSIGWVEHPGFFW